MSKFNEQIASTPTEDLEDMLRDSSAMISAIRTELNRRRVQHEQIDQLDTLLEDARPKLNEVREFFRSVLEDLRSPEEKQ